jgi:hypothetical protein
MSITYIGKIGRLPKCTRDDLGHRLEDGEPGRELVKWLNGLPGVQRVLKEQFGGRPVTEQNLSEWKQHGHQDWLRREETRLLVSRLTEQSEDLDEAAEGQEISDRFGSVLAAEITRLAMILLEKETDPEKRWQRLCEVNGELSRLRRDDHRAVRTFIKRERWDRETEREEEENEKRTKQESKQRMIDLCFAQMRNETVAGFGGGEHGKMMAELLHHIKFDLPFEKPDGTKLSGQAHPNGIKVNPTESSLIQPKKSMPSRLSHHRQPGHNQ